MSHRNTQSVLIIDDHEFIRSSLSLILSQLGVEKIETASNGKMASKMLLQHGVNAFDLIFCDLKMPEQDGLVFLHKLKEIRYLGAIVLMTGEDPEVLKAAEILGKNYGLWILALIEKPITAKNCREFLDQSKNHRRQKLKNTDVILTDEQVTNAIHQKLLTVYMQPQVKITSGQVCGFEALVRIDHPEYGVLPPDSFLKSVENSDLIFTLTDYVIHKAFAWNKRLHDIGYTTTISINLSSRIVENQDFPNTLLQYAKKYNLAPEFIVCELTESMLTSDPNLMLATMARLRLHKFRLSIDDFGTGFATFEQLQTLPFHELKIDKCFVQDFEMNNKSLFIIENSLHLANDLKLSTVAEGVETERCFKKLEQFGCDIAQGYYIARPMPANEMLDWLSEWGEQ